MEIPSQQKGNEYTGPIFVIDQQADQRNDDHQQPKDIVLHLASGETVLPCFIPHSDVKHVCMELTGMKKQAG